MAATLERELKLEAGAGFKLPQLEGEQLPERLFVSTYHDTPELLLARLGITLRRRVENGRSVWQLKLPRPGGRLELEEAGGPGGPPAPIARLLAAVLRGRKLAPVATLRTRRAGVRVHENGSVAELVSDSVTVLEGARATATFDELEIELLEGDERLLHRLARVLGKAGAAPGAGLPKVFRVLGLEEPQPVARRAPALEHVRALLETQLGALLASDPGVRVGGEPEDVHGMRVATRRLRAGLRAARPLLDREWADGLRAELKWLGGALGTVRDAEVLDGHLRAEIELLDPADRRGAKRLLTQLGKEHRTARAELVGMLESERYLELVDRLQEAAAAPRAAAADLSLAEVAARRFRKLRRAVRALGDEPSDEALHRARIEGKRARYAAELAAASAGKRAGRFVRRAKRFQDVVGEHQDAVVAEERIRALAEPAGPEAAFAAGRLVERERARRRRARAAVPKAWRNLERAGKRAWS